MPHIFADIMKYVLFMKITSYTAKYSIRPELPVAEMDVSRRIFSSRHIHFYPFPRQVIRDGGSMNYNYLLTDSGVLRYLLFKFLCVLCT